MRITQHGRVLAAFPTHPRIAHMLLRARETGHAGVACDLAALLGGRDILRPAALGGRLDADLKKFAQKLGNPAFLSKAKPEVVEEQREREADARRDRDRLQAVYERIGG